MQVAEVQGPATLPALAATTVRRQAALVSATTVLTSVANYGFSLIVIHLLVPEAYVHFASVQGLLLVLGSGCMAAVPWAIARHVAISSSPRAGAEALGFGLFAAAVQGFVFAAVGFAVVVPVAGAALGAATAVAAFALSLVAAPLGLLQGQQRLVTMSVLRIIETAVRLGVSLLLLVAVAAEPVSPVIGFAVGSAVLFVVGMVACRRVLPLRRASTVTFRHLLTRSASLGAVQIVLAAVGVMDTVVVAVAAVGDGPASAYQVAALLGRVPLYLSTAIALTYYQGLARAQTDAQVQRELGQATRLVVVMAVPVAALVATCPPLLLDVLSAGRPDAVGRLLPLTAWIGMCIALVTVLATAHQAREAYRRFFTVMGPVVLVQPVALVVAGHVGGVAAYATAGAAVASIAVLLVAADVRRWSPWGQLSRADLLLLGAVVVLAGASRVQPWLWLASGLLAFLTLAWALGVRPFGRSRQVAR